MGVEYVVNRLPAKAFMGKKGVATALRWIWTISLCVLIISPPECRGDVISDADRLLVQLNPISASLDGLIGEAAGKGDAVLQRQLEHLRGIIKEAIFDLDQVAKKRIDQLDEAMVKNINLINQYVRDNLVVFDSIVGRHLSQLDRSMYDRINQFNFGLANVLASIQFINTIPLIQMDEEQNGISTFKQTGDATLLYIVGSGFTKHGEPSAYLSSASLKSDLSSAWGLLGNGKSVSVKASMGLIEVTIPNELIPDSYGPTNMSLDLKIPQDGILKYDHQAIPLHVCGSLPRIFATVSVKASGKHYLRTTAEIANLVHTACQAGNNNNENHVCLPPVPPPTWDFDFTDGGIGITYDSQDNNNYGRIVPSQPTKYCLKAYCEGVDGNAHQNIYGVKMKLIKVDDLSPCVGVIYVPSARDQPSTPSRIELRYFDFVQSDLNAAVSAAVGGGCAELASKYPPTLTETVELTNSANEHIESVSLIPGIPVRARTIDAEFTLGKDQKLSMEVRPKCQWHPTPRTN